MKDRVVWWPKIKVWPKSKKKQRKRLAKLQKALFPIVVAAVTTKIVTAPEETRVFGFQGESVTKEG